MAKTKIQESKLLKALAELEESVEKGDVLEDADPEGGLSAEGEPLSSGAPRGRGESTKKSRRASSSSSPVASSSSDDSSSGDDDDEDGGAAEAMSARRAPLFQKKGKKGKVSKAASMSDSSSSGSDESSDDSGSDESSDAEKSFRDMVEEDETMRKGIIVNPFLEAMVDQISLAMLAMKQSLAKSMVRSLEAMEKRIVAQVGGAVSKSIPSQADFNVRLAKAVAAIGNTVQDDLIGRIDGMTDMVKALANQPVGSPRGKSVLSKGEVNQPPWSGPGVGDQRGDSGDVSIEQLRELSTDVVGDWLFKKQAANQIDSRIILAWEADRYNPEALPPQVRKALANDLIK